MRLYIQRFSWTLIRNICINTQTCTQKYTYVCKRFAKEIIILSKRKIVAREKKIISTMKPSAYTCISIWVCNAMPCVQVSSFHPYCNVSYNLYAYRLAIVVAYFVQIMSVHSTTSVSGFHISAAFFSSYLCSYLYLFDTLVSHWIVFVFTEIFIKHVSLFVIVCYHNYRSTVAAFNRFASQRICMYIVYTCVFIRQV